MCMPGRQRDRLPGMTISSTVRTAGPYDGNDVALTFPYAFKVFSKTDLRVWLETPAGVQSLLVVDTDYLVTINADQNAAPGGNVALPTPLAAGYRLFISTQVPALQPLRLTNSGGFYPGAIETELDRLTVLIQQLQQSEGGTEQALRVPDFGGVPLLPSASLRANRVLSFDEFGQPTTIAFVDSSAAQLQIDLASASAGKGDSLIAVKRDAAGSVARTAHESQEDKEYFFEDFGADGDGIGDDTTAVVAGIVASQISMRTVRGRPGSIYKLTDTVVLSGQPACITGEPDGPMQQGSTLPAVTFRWTGGAKPMFRMESSGWSFVGFAVENRGTATDWLQVDGGQHCLFDRLSFLPATGTTRFSRSVIYCPANELGYSTFRTIHYQNVAPTFLKFDATGATNGVTPIVFEGRCVFESNSLGATTILRTKACTFDSIRFTDATFNSNDGQELCVVDTTDTPNAIAIASLIFDGACEFDTSASTSTMRYLRLTNCPNVHLVGAQIQGGGTATNFANLANSTVTRFDSNFVERFAGPLFSCDSNSRVYPGLNYWNTTNTQGVQNNRAGEFGQVLKGKYASLAVAQSTTSTSYADLPNIAATLQPSCHSSKVRVNVNMTGIAVNAASTAVGFAIARNGTVIAEFEKEAGFAGAVTTELAVGGVSCTFLDEPAAVTALAYTIQWKRVAGAGTCYVSVANSRSTLEVAEMAF